MSTVLLGDNYLLWIAATGSSPTFAVIQGQGTATINTSQNKISTSSKTTQGYGTSAYGLADLTIDLDFLPTLPDPVYTLFEGFCLAVPRTPFLMEIRKGGLNGQEADAVFAASVYGTLTTVPFTQADKVQCKAQMGLASAPTKFALA